MPKFTHLHVHTEFSLLDGLSKIGKLVAKTKEFGQTHVAITDHGSMYGVIEFYKKSTKEEVKPIIGCEVYLAKGSRFDRTKSDALTELRRFTPRISSGIRLHRSEDVVA